MMVVFCEGGILSGWSFVWVAFYEGGLLCG